MAKKVITPSEDQIVEFIVGSLGYMPTQKQYNAAKPKIWRDCITMRKHGTLNWIKVRRLVQSRIGKSKKKPPHGVIVPSEKMILEKLLTEFESLPSITEFDQARPRGWRSASQLNRSGEIDWNAIKQRAKHMIESACAPPLCENIATRKIKIAVTLQTKRLSQGTIKVCEACYELEMQERERLRTAGRSSTGGREFAMARSGQMFRRALG